MNPVLKKVRLPWLFVQVFATHPEWTEGVPKAAWSLPEAAGDAGQAQAHSGGADPAKHHPRDPDG